MKAIGRWILETIPKILLWYYHRRYVLKKRFP